MQHSRSLGSFVSSCIDSDTENLLPDNRPRNRSSLDTLIIPGRIRIPSQKADPLDEELAQNLLKSAMAHARAPPPYSENSRPSPHQQRLASFSSEGSASDQHVQYHVGDSIYRIGPLPTPRIGSRDNIVVPHRRHHRNERESNYPHPSKQSSHSPRYRPTYDGALDSSQESRVTSTTWSTVSKVSHRIFSDSSSEVRDTSRFQDQYNNLATKHGLPEFALPPMGPAEEKPSVKSITKEHKHGWLARKFLPRPSASYTYRSRTTYRPIARKKSFSRVPSLTDGGRRNILEGKTLEETCRLGGLGVLMLPYEYAFDKLTLPTCLSATAAYLLQHGVNAPGLFRVSGQTAIVNALYDYYSHQFGQAGSPSKVQTTVQPGQLPLHIEYALPDVASFFKKVLNALPGGLLGSVELFEAIRAIFLKLEPDPALADDVVRELKAKLVALAILSVPLQCRFHLIQAVLGLAAYFGQEAETSREIVQSKVKEDPEKKSPSELMGYQALGVCLGPLLIGDLIEKVDLNEEATDEASRPSSESNPKFKKKRLSLAPNKLERNADLTAHIERANLTANIMQNLLMIWREVVKQLNMIAAPNKSTQKARSSHQLRRLNDRVSIGHSVKVSDEELFFLDIMRGGRVPEQHPLDVVMKRKVKAKSRSSMPRLILIPSDEEPLLKVQRPETLGQADVAGEVKTPTRGKRKAMIQLPTRKPSDQTRNEEEYFPRECPPPRPDQVRNDSGMDSMSMGQILPPRESSRHNSSSISSHRRHHTTVRTPKYSGSRRSSIATPETALKDLSGSDRDTIRDLDYPAPSLNKPLPAVVPDRTDLILLEPSHQKKAFPPRQSSLASDKISSARSCHTPDAQTDLDTGHKARAITNITECMSFDHPEGEIPKELLNRQEPDSPKSSDNSHSDAKSLVAAGGGRSELPYVHAYINSLPTPQSHLDDPFTFLERESSPKSSLIPKPVKELGHGRQASSRSISPPKSVNTPKRRQTALDSFDGDSALLNKNSHLNQNPSLTGWMNYGGAEKGVETAPTRPLSAYTTESLQRHDLSLEEPQTAQLIPRRNLSFERGRSASPSRSATNLYPSEPIETTVRRSGSANATLYAEITRLQKQLKQKTEEVLAMKRSLDAARETKEQGSGTNAPKRGSWNKGTLTAEVWEVRRDRDNWKKRAERAERRLQGLGPLAQTVANNGQDESSGDWGENRSLNGKEKVSGKKGVAQNEVQITLSLDDYRNDSVLEDSA